MSTPKTPAAGGLHKSAPPHDHIAELRGELVKLIIQVGHLEAAVERLDRFVTHQVKDLGDRVKDLDGRVG